MELTNNTENMVINPPGEGLEYVREGERLFGEGRLDEARAMFLSATEECPGNAMAWNNLAVIAINENSDREAEKYLRRALEIKSDLLEASFNLVEIYCFRGQWAKAIREIERILEIKPGDLPATKALARVYMAMGDPGRAKEVLDESQNLGAMKAFIDSLWLGIKYYAMADELNARAKLEKYTAAVLKFLDGQDGRSLRYRLSGRDPETGREVVLEDFFDSFYYKESAPLDARGDEIGEKPGDLVLTIGEHDDWKFFQNALRAEMRAEGGCLGDFTQTRKVLRREARLAKYSLAATLRYFQDNVGPCDCHVLRAVLV